MRYLELRSGESSSRSGDRDSRSGKRRQRKLGFAWVCEVLERRATPTASLAIATPLPFPAGNSGTSDMVFVVSRTGDTTTALTCDYTTQDGTASAGVDYVATSGTLGFAAGQTLATIDVPIIGNTIFQSDRTFTVTLSATPAVPTFSPVQTFAAGGQPDTVAIADINGDGRPDIVVAENSQSATEPGDVAVLLNTTAPGSTVASFAPPQLFSTGDIQGADTPGPVLQVGDINGDGRPDIVVLTPETGVSVLLNTTRPGAAVASFAPSQTFNTGSGPQSLALGDINGDGRPDIVVTNTGDNTVSVLLNTTPTGPSVASFAPHQDFPTPIEPGSVALGDINGDGLTDIVVASIYNPMVSVLLNTTPTGSNVARFAPRQDFSVNGQASTLALGDLNGDGRPDIIFAGDSTDYRCC